MVYINVCNFLFTTKIINIQIFVHNAWSSLFQIEADTPIAKLGKPKEILVSPLKIGPVRKIMFDSHIPVKVLSTNIQRYDLKPSNKYKCKSSQYLDLHVCQCLSKKNNDKQMVCKRAGIVIVCLLGAVWAYYIKVLYLLVRHHKRLYMQLNKVMLCFSFGGSRQSLKVREVKCIPRDPTIPCPVLFKGSCSPLSLA